jgi:NTP pyrophosphatase (non-canonical NTP hydrolase)
MESKQNIIVDQNMRLNEYQDAAVRTLMRTPDFELTQDETVMTLTVLSLCIVVGQLAEKVKKGVFHRQGLKIEEFAAYLDTMTDRSMQGVDGLSDEVKLSPHVTSVVWNVLGLIGESSEVGQLAMNAIKVDTTEYLELMFKKELGDVDWYRAAIAEKIGLKLGEIAAHNVEKLMARFPDGYSHARTTVREGGAD